MPRELGSSVYAVNEHYMTGMEHRRGVTDDISILDETTGVAPD